MDRDNIIYNLEKELVIGYYEDLEKEYKQEMKEAIDDNNFEQVDFLEELLIELKDHAKEKGLLVISMGNGMGITIKKYKGE